MVRLGKRKLFVHVGLAKTGSKSIQRMLHACSPVLEQLDCHVLAAGAYRGNSSFLALAGAAAHWAALRREAIGCRASRLVLSGEVYTNPGLQEAAIGRFEKLAQLADLDVEIIGVVRPQWQWIEAWWATGVKGGRFRQSFQDTLPQLLRDHRLDYAAAFQPWQRTFGRLHVLPLEASPQSSLLARFLGVLGVEDRALLTSSRRHPRFNQRLGAKTIEVYRLVAVALDELGITGGTRLRQMERLEGVADLLPDDRPFAGLSCAQVDRLRRRYASRNASFAREFGFDTALESFWNAPDRTTMRPWEAQWWTLNADEQARVRDFVRSSVGVDLAIVTRGGMRRDFFAGHQRRASPEPAAIRAARLAAGCGRAVAEIARDMLSGVSQVRRGCAGLRVARWLVWQVSAMASRLRIASSRRTTAGIGRLTGEKDECG